MGKDLAEAERVMRTPRNYTWSEQLDAFALLAAEYDRRGECLKGRDLEQHALRNAIVQLSAQAPIVQAATTLVEEWEAIRNPADKLVWTIAEQLTERLATAVHGETRSEQR